MLTALGLGCSSGGLISAQRGDLLTRDQAAVRDRARLGRDKCSSLGWRQQRTGGVSARMQGPRFPIPGPSTLWDPPCPAIPMDLSYRPGDASMSARKRGGCLLSPKNGSPPKMSTWCLRM